MKWVYDDGGRFAAGYQYHVDDCVCRALSTINMPLSGSATAAKNVRCG
jgi:hypothetical protein